MIKLKMDAVALINILRSEKESYQELLNLAKREQDLIVKGDIEGLSDVVKATEHLMFTVRDLEDKRLTLLSVFNDSTLPQPSPELSAIIKNLDEPEAREAKGLKDEMLSIIEDLGEVNRTNAELIKRNIGYVDFLLSALMREENPTYGDKPSPQGSSPKLFDGRA